MRSCPFGKHVDIINSTYGEGAYHIVHERNNGHIPSLTSQGEPSILFETLKYLYGEENAFKIKAQIYFDEYKSDLNTDDFFGGEPRIRMSKDGEYYFNTNSGTRRITDLRPTTPTAVSDEFRKYRIATSGFFTDDELAKIEYIINVPTFREKYKRIEEVSIAPWSAATVTVNGERAFNVFAVIQSTPERIEEMAGNLRAVTKIKGRLYLKKKIAPELEREFNAFRNSVNAVYPGMIDDSQVNKSGRVIKINPVKFSVDEDILGDLLGRTGSIESAYPEVYDAKLIEKKALAVWAADLKSRIEIYNTPSEDEGESTAYRRARIQDRRMIIEELERVESKMDGILTDLKKKGHGQQGLINTLMRLAENDLEELETADLHEHMNPAALTYYAEKIALWAEMSNMTGAHHFALTPAEVNTYGDTLNEIFQKFAPYNRKLETLKEKKVLNYVNDQLGKDLSIEEVFKSIKDNWAASQLLSIDKIDHPLVRLLYIETKNANAQITREQAGIFKEYEELLKKAMPRLKELDSKDPMSVLRQEQVDEKGNLFYNGNLVHPYSAVFLSERDSRASAIKNEDSIKRKSAQKRYYKWLDQNVIYFDYSILFPFEGEEVSQEERQAYIEELYRQGGKEHVDTLLKYAERMANQFKTDRLEQEILLKDMRLSDSDKEREMHLWDLKNSPYIYNDNTPFIEYDGVPYYPPKRYSRYIPKRFIIVNGKEVESGYYDKKYDTIRSDENLKALHSFMTNTLRNVNTYVPSWRNRQGTTILPLLKKTLVEEYYPQLFTMGGPLNLVKDHLITQLRENATKDTLVSAPIAPSTGEPFRRLDINSVSKAEAVSREIRRLRADYASKGTSRNYHQLKAEASRIVAEEHSDDVDKVFRLTIQQGLIYKHKAATEDMLRMSQDLFFKYVKEQKITPQGTPIRDSKKSIDGPSNIQRAVRNHMDYYWGDRTKKIEGATKNKAYTKEEILIKERLEEMLKQYTTNASKIKSVIGDEEYEKVISELKDDLETLGGVYSGGKAGDLLLKWIQLQGLGWNVTAAVANLGFGVLSNATLALDGRVISKNNFLRAYKLAMHSMVRNASFNHKTTETAQKIRNLMDNLGVLKDSSNEIFRNKGSVLKGRLGWLQAYNLTKRTEYMNQAPIMIGILMEYNSKGEKVKEGEKSLWELADSDGNMKGVDDEVLNNIMLKIDDVNKWGHGNYDLFSRLLAKSTLAGRMLTIFRTWMFEGFYSRWGREQEFEYLGITRKGRWRSYAEAFSSWEKVAWTAKQSMLQLAGKSNWGDRLNDTDAANMRANIAELIMLGGIMVMSALLKALSEDEDEGYRTAYFIVNMMTRMETDIMLYVNPMEFEQLSKSTIPAARVISDWVDVMHYGAAYIFDNESDELKSGPFKGDSKLWRASREALPILSQYNRSKRAVESLYED